MWRVFRFSRPFTNHKAFFNVKLPKPGNVKLTAKVGTAFLIPSLLFLDLPKVHAESPSSHSQSHDMNPIPIKASGVVDDVNKKEASDTSWVTIRDVMHITKLLLVGGLVWGLSGVLLGGALFRICTSVGYHVTRVISIPVCILSGAGLAMVGLHRALGHSLTYFIHKGLAGYVLKKVVPKRATDATVIHWDAAVHRVTYSFKMKASQSGFFTRMVLSTLARRLESFLLLVKSEDKLLKKELSEEVINHKLTKLIEHQMRKPLYFVGVAYGIAFGAVAVLVWRS